MNSSAFRTAEILKPQARPPLYWTFADALVLARRHLIQIPRIPEELIFATIQPMAMTRAHGSPRSHGATARSAC